VAATPVDAALVAAGPMGAAVDGAAAPVAAAPVDAALVAAETVKGAAPMDSAAPVTAAAPVAAAGPVAAAAPVAAAPFVAAAPVTAATIVAAAVPLVAATTLLAAEQAAPAAAWSTEGPFFLLEAQTSRLCLSFSLLLSLLGRFLTLRRVVGVADGLLLQQRLISSSPSRDSSCTRTHNPSAAQALYTARMLASGLKEGLPGVGWGCRTPFPATSAHEGAMVGGREGI
jgi:hypothetical protein